MNQLHLDQIRQALGTEVVDELRDRELLRSVQVPVWRRPRPELVTERAVGAVAGLALGDALVEWLIRSKQRPIGPDTLLGWMHETDPSQTASVSAVTQLFVQSAEAWQQGWTAPPAIADLLAQRGDGLRLPGHAVRRAVRGLQKGRPWHRAASGSYGDAALPRAVATGLASLADPERAPLAGSLDAVVTHRSRSAALCSATLSALVTALVLRPRSTEWTTVARKVIGSVDFAPTRKLLERALEPSDVPPVGEWQGDVHPYADEQLAIAIWSLHRADVADVMMTALHASDGNRTAVAVASALFGAVHGAGALPPRTGAVEGIQVLVRLAERLADPSAVPAPSTAHVPTTDDGAGADIWFLVDRSGSMSSIARDVVAGFDGFFAEQRSVAGEATVTVVQFDDADPHDVIVDARPIDEVRSIADRFEPRGCTPLYDAIGRLLDRAEARGGVADDQLVVIFTDGLENASSDWTRERIFRRINALRAKGWTFVFLGANQDSYEVGDGMAMAAGNVSNFRADPASVAASYAGLSRSVREYRGKARSARRRDQDDFWGGVKEGEQA